MRQDTRIKLAGLLSNILNPFLMTFVAFVLLAFKSRENIVSGIRWSLVLFIISLAPILLIAAYLVRKGKLDSLFNSVRQQRTELYLLAGAVTAVDYIILRYINAPPLLIAGLGTGLLGLEIFMCLNFWRKISLHTGFVTAVGIAAGICYGWIGLVALVPLGLVGWARIELKEHTVTQVIAGALLAGLIGFVSFHLFGFV